MNLFKSIETKISSVFSFIGDKVGKGINFLEAHTGVVITLENDMLTALKNPAADFAHSTVLPKSLTDQEPRLETLLQNAINAETVGMKIQEEVAAEPTTEGKLKIIIAFVQANPTMNTGFVGRICAAVLANLNNNALSTEEYNLYLAAKNLLG